MLPLQTKGSGNIFFQKTCVFQKIFRRLGVAPPFQGNPIWFLGLHEEKIRTCFGDRPFVKVFLKSNKTAFILLTNGFYLYIWSIKKYLLIMKLYYLSTILLLVLFSACVKEDLVDQVVPEDENVATLPVTSDAMTEEREVPDVVQASFDVELTNGTVDENISLNLTNLSKNAVSYEWSFGNGDTSTEEIPSYKYDVHGYYTITLKAIAANGQVSEMSKEVLVLCIYGGGDHGF